MGLTYDGITYRSLEEQVRYDAEQVQLLKQADVTINENLQTINTEINGKLTKPTNPSAESAVTMLADGTVGTKPLSEIGGGKLYRHEIHLSFLNFYDGNDLIFYIYNTSSNSLFLGDISDKSYVASFAPNDFYKGVLSCYIGPSNSNVTAYGVIIDESQGSKTMQIASVVSNSSEVGILDTVTEL